MMRFSAELHRSLVSWLRRGMSAGREVHVESSLIETAKGEIIDHLPLGVAIFQRDRRLLLSNARFRERIGLTQPERAQAPTFEEVLDTARANRKIPEQRDFARWKIAKIKLFDAPGEITREIWSLPDGRVQRMTFLRNALGGLTIEIEDLTDRLDLLTAYNSLQRVHKATLESIEDGIAIFGPDGCLRVHNRAFRRILSVDEALLFSLPHVSKLSQICAPHFGADEMWSAILFAINSDAPAEDKARRIFTRANGRMLTLSLRRLPDGGTIVRFDDVAADKRFKVARKGRASD